LYLISTVCEVETRKGIQNSIGDKLRMLRREAGLSQRTLAQKLDLSHQQIQKYERGNNALPLNRVKSFAAALGVEPAILAFPEIDWTPIEPGMALSTDRAELLRLYDAIPDRESRLRLLDLVRTLGGLVKTLI
jgi:transcriptional regulator with XRE-family HTH domain